MAKKLILNPIVTLAISTIALTGCSAANSEVSGLNDQTITEQVSAESFDAALGKLKVTTDEFKGNYEIFAKFDKSFLNFESGMRMVLGADVTRSDEKSPWEFGIVSSYAGEDWMFHDEISIKSDKGTLIIPVDPLSRNDQVDNGVSEMGVTTLTDDQINSFCSIVEADSVKYRLSGTRGAVSDMTANMKPKSRQANVDACTVYFGLNQGLSIAK